MLENLEQFSGSRPGPSRCKVRDVRESLEPADREILDNALKEDSDFSTNALWRGLRHAGIDIGYQTVYRHRNKSCNCGQTNA